MLPYYHQRRLPHWVPPNRDLFVTWRLYGSLPAIVLQALAADKDLTQGRKFLRMDRELDGAGFGPSWLMAPEIAEIVSRSIQQVAEGGLCTVHSYVVMPNHVHVLLQPKVDLHEVMKLIKGTSARACNLALKRTGKPFWNQESFDHWVRDSCSFGKIHSYIEMNPVSAGLVKKPHDWPWSSAHKS
jgi:putative transposase